MDGYRVVLPRIFQPTDEFQVVHDDQELPSGLHVRLNIWTGVKEAKINDPDEVDSSLEGLPVDKAVVVVEPEEGEAQEQAPPRIPDGAPAYEPVGKIKQPPVEETGFWDALKVSLLDISSDIYYGLKLTEDKDATQALLCLMVKGDAEGQDRQAAARILAGAMQNNAKALEQVAQEWENLMSSKCGGATLRDAFYASHVPGAAEALSPAAASRVGSTVFAIKGLLQSTAIRDDFLASGGMKKLAEVMAVDDAAWDGAQRKVGYLLLDTFLDHDAGASLGLWPRGLVAGDDACAKGEDGGQEDGCWEFYLKSIVQRHQGEKGHWSEEVYDKLRAARKGAENKGNRRVKEEL
ncbi:unnamed protein product [Parascedosporium putredinis]|uniref:Nucleotide exchange factor SIL1 n=1 Tax=Parascedosporium putredinis TaxID=1442378 RepID=A0A9P1H7D6_9PEZI|nr:unnamed protein product [Parascedosporium putredinis]CAI7998422.1 unnamed protein product [Parascedosporium putredinis]